MAITQNNLKADVKADLYSLFIDGYTAELMGETALGDTPIRWYDGIGTSMASDDGENVIQPTGISGAGRWVKRRTEQIQADWSQASSGSQDYIKNKPSIPSAQIQADWNQVSSGALDFIKNKPTIPTAKRVETYLGTTDGSGNYTVTYGTAFSTVPDIQPQLQGGSNTQLIKITSTTTTGFTVNVQNRTDTLGLLPSYAAVSGASVGVLVTSR